MPFIPHTAKDIQDMLATIKVSAISQLFDEIPPDLLFDRALNIPEGVNESALMRLMRERAAQDDGRQCFIGAGAYEHHIPAVVSEIASRGEFYTAYTPYQAEASQGTLQLLYEFQTMMTQLTGMDVSNASLYDGASALAEAVLMAVRCQKNHDTKRVLVPKTLHPYYRKVLKSIVQTQAIEVIECSYSKEEGRTTLRDLEIYAADQITALVIPQINFFGVLEDVDMLSAWARERGVITVAVANPMMLSVLKAPGTFADIVCGEGQPLGIPLASGGPYFGFLCCKEAFMRQMPGRIVGRTIDLDGKTGYTLTLQAREQHIRRAKATSNICTNQGLAVCMATVYMSLMGTEGLKRVALACHANTQTLLQKIAEIKGVKRVFSGEFWNEVVIQLDRPLEPILIHLAKENIQAGFNLSHDYPELENCLLICATETKTYADLSNYAKMLEECLP